ncbi:hypothetical protein GCM10022254_26700 [Actinomadura meridiana]|uniref:N-acetyltransferase domain-containing protein n=1 Tax=Actinomadura meridiana TaxID=559626 RepID=A0ABP8BZ85_9ACTN
MGWTLTDDLDVFLDRAGDFLRDDPVANTVPLTVTQAMRARGPGLYDSALFGWWTDGGRVGAAMLWTSGYPPLLSAMPEQAARELAGVLAGRDGAAVPGIEAAWGIAETFARAWTDATGAASRVALRERLYRLTRLAAPDPPPEGAARVAGAADRDLVLDLHAAFHRDAGGHGEMNRKVVEGKLAEGCLMLWEVEGRPVALAGRTPVVAEMARVAPVYTPTRHRNRGYGAAVTTAATRAAQDAGAAHVVLFTDLANPTSNGIYQRLGYHPVEDRVVIAFT